MTSPRSLRRLAFPVRWRRPAVLGSLTLTVLLLGSPPSRAEVLVPIDLQVDLLRKVVRFERGFGRRSGTVIKVVLVSKAGDARSDRAAGQLGSALERAPEIAGIPIQIVPVAFRTADELKKTVVAEGAPLVLLTSGLAPDLAAIAAALVGVPAITVSTDGDDVDRGAVLGFELVSSKPKIVLNLGQARKQGLDFNSDLFRLARIIP